MNALEQLVSTVQLDAGMFSRAVLRGDWAIQVPRTSQAVFHVVVRGSGRIRVGPRCLDFGPGDLILLPSGAPHRLLGPQGETPEVADAIRLRPPAPRHRPSVRQVRFGDVGNPTRMLSGTFKVHGAARPFLLRPLGDVLVVHPKQQAAWLEESLSGPTAPKPESSGSGELARDLVVRMFGEIVEQGVGHGCLAGLASPDLRPALEALHNEPHATWSVSDLATRAGAGKGPFIQRFQSVMGQTPSAYLTDWRKVVARILSSNATEPRTVAPPASDPAATPTKPSTIEPSPDPAASERPPAVPPDGSENPAMA